MNVCVRACVTVRVSTYQHSFRRKQSGHHKHTNLDCPLSGFRCIPDLQVVIDFQQEEERLYGVECVFGRVAAAVRTRLHVISG
jgi:hypothetical protein